jgi:hypothetical protein
MNESMSNRIAHEGEIGAALDAMREANGGLKAPVRLTGLRMSTSTKKNRGTIPRRHSQVFSAHE